MSNNPPPGPPEPWGPPPQPFGPPPPTPQGAPPSWARKRVVVPAALIVFAVGAAAGAAGASGNGDGTAEAKPGPTVTVTAEPAAPAEGGEAPPEDKPGAEKPKDAKSVTIPGEGTFVVGEDVQPGTYKTSGPSDSEYPNCYWARLRSTSGDFEDIISNGTPSGQTTVTISGGDGAFETTGCAEWKKSD
ncbi:hypothetical protein [Streptomyces sp. NPDC058653]|uniref:hypothetical protein n=1 Tax=Streptomyces sp. NPDC058653 TaxID=3346576 RepID=UPI00366496B5